MCIRDSRDQKELDKSSGHVKTRGAEGQSRGSCYAHIHINAHTYERNTYISLCTKPACPCTPLNEDNGHNRSWHFENTALLSCLLRQHVWIHLVYFQWLYLFLPPSPLQSLFNAIGGVLDCWASWSLLTFSNCKTWICLWFCRNTIHTICKDYQR